MNSQTNYSTKINFTNPHLHNTTVSRHCTVCYNTNNKKMLRRGETLHDNKDSGNHQQIDTTATLYTIIKQQHNAVTLYIPR
jgi:hypothetical protein